MHLQLPAVIRHSILIVDDDLAARRQLCRLLAANGYAVIEAGNGRVARGLLAAQEIDLVQSDIFMPECYGFELMAAIRAMERPVPVIAMSEHESWTGLSFLDAANDLGAAAVIEKPFRADVLLRLLDETLIGAAPNASTVLFGAVAEPEPGCIPSGLEWVGGRPAE
jgi:DNA-binding NtrC family response regulator